MKKRTKNLLDIFLRYAILILIALPGLQIFYFLFSSLTIYPVFFLLNLFYDVSLSGNVIQVLDRYFIEIIAACVAGSAYYLLFILSMSLRKIKLRRRLNLIFLSFLLFLIANILRVFILSVLYVSNFSFFDIAHKVFWYTGSIILVIFIWFVLVKIFKIKEIPFMEDIKFLSRLKR